MRRLLHSWSDFCKGAKSIVRCKKLSSKSSACEQGHSLTRELFLFVLAVRKRMLLDDAHKAITRHFNRIIMIIVRLHHDVDWAKRNARDSYEAIL